MVREQGWTCRSYLRCWNWNQVLSVIQQLCKKVDTFFEQKPIKKSWSHPGGGERDAAVSGGRGLFQQNQGAQGMWTFLSPSWGCVAAMLSSLCAQGSSLQQADNAQAELLPKRKGSRRSWVLLWLLALFCWSFLASKGEARVALQDLANIKQLCWCPHACLCESPCMWLSWFEKPMKTDFENAGVRKSWVDAKISFFLFFTARGFELSACICLNGIAYSKVVTL